MREIRLYTSDENGKQEELIHSVEYGDDEVVTVQTARVVTVKKQKIEINKKYVWTSAPLMVETKK